jgi:GNAT superfamily N-acetyltransferase
VGYIQDQHVQHVCTFPSHALLRCRLTILTLRYTRSSFGWDPPQKKVELFHPDSRFILVWERTGNASDGRRLSAFAMFRFDMEDDDRIVYWSVTNYILFCGFRIFTPCCSYELQVAASARRQGLGQHLMKLLVILGRASDMEKVMLTVQKCESEIGEAPCRNSSHDLQPTLRHVGSTSLWGASSSCQI